jgi:membrane-bound lytic murein transglycosylase D
MLRMRLLLVLCCFFVVNVVTYGATSYQVPRVVRFVDLSLHLADDARRLVQAKVDELTKSELYLDILCEKAGLFFPLIEKILKEEGVHLDFKYLIIQESGLVSDAVSTSNAVGFWQFKKEAALEMGLLINDEIDERMHIIHATRGAAKYLIYNNKNFFNNWLYALLAYNQGAGGALQIVDKKYFGKKYMRLSGSTHWYIIHFLAHKIVFERLKYKKYPSRVKLHIYEGVGSINSKDIASKFNVELSLLKDYNLWLKKDIMSSHGNYSFIIPVGADRKFDPVKSAYAHSKTIIDIAFYKKKEKPGLFPLVSKLKDEDKVLANHERIVSVNGLLGIVSKEGDTIGSLAGIGNISKQRFIECNELDEGHFVRGGQVYYFVEKRTRAEAHYHVVRGSESVWEISQKYGIKVSSLLNKNRFKNLSEVDIKEGAILWLRFIRPKHLPMSYMN